MTLSANSEFALILSLSSEAQTSCTDPDKGIGVFERIQWMNSGKVCNCPLFSSLLRCHPTLGRWIGHLLYADV